MMKRIASFFSIQLFILSAYCQPEKDAPCCTIRQEVAAITQVMFHDVTDPPAAARFYAYSILTGYEIIADYEKGNSLLFRNPLKMQRPLINKPAGVDLHFAALYGLLETGKSILPSGYLLEDAENRLKNEYRKKGMTENSLRASVSYAGQISGVIVKFAHEDGYFKLSTMPRYKPFATEESWQATPPEYMAAIQPHWAMIRPFFMDSAAQFKPAPMVPFSKDTLSPFFKLVYQVYLAGKNLDSTQKLIANFWDCNPFAVQFEGHMSVGLKKISPGGHWMGITGTVCEQQQFSFEKTMFIHAVVAMALHDAFISCWDEKYKSNRIRPETAINRYIDEKWQPLIQTPPFPECTSGHSVISTAAAVVLTAYVGDSFSFTDSTEMYIGLPARKFNSFMEAAVEAGISRFYGGIHFWDSIANGRDEGAKVGNWVLQSLKTKNWVGQ
jgi:PAP2 superfamily